MGSLSLKRYNLLLLLLLFTANPSSSSKLSEGIDEKVTVALYYETLCPYCSNLIVNYLYKIFEDGLDSIVDLKLIPYGNAKINPSNNTITCQKVSLGLYYEPFGSAKFFINDFTKIFHNGLIDMVDLNLVPWGNAKLRKNNTINFQHGPTECLLNTIEACAIHVWPDVKEHFPYIYCIETFVYEHDYGQWETCFEKLNLDPRPVTDCYASGLGDKLELQYAAETNALEPHHTYVPWLVVDGQPLYDDYADFISYICKAYKGTTLPKACSESSLRTSTEEKANGNNPVCYTVIKTTLSRLGSAITSWIRQDNVAASI